MEKFKIKNEEMLELSNINKIEFEKYVSQIVNLANQNAQGTRPKMVGQLSELFPEFLKESEDTSIESWKEWYINKNPKAIDDATNKIYMQILNLKEAIKNINLGIVRQWVVDLIINKTYMGLNLQELIIKKIAKLESKPYRLSNPSEESKGIDGYIGEQAVSVKPSSYNTKQMLNEVIDVKIIYYEKKKDGVEVYFN